MATRDSLLWSSGHAYSFLSCRRTDTQPKVIGTITICWVLPFITYMPRRKVSILSMYYHIHVSPHRQYDRRALHRYSLQAFCWSQNSSVMYNAKMLLLGDPVCQTYMELSIGELLAGSYLTDNYIYFRDIETITTNGSSVHRTRSTTY